MTNVDYLAGYRQGMLDAHEDLNSAAVGVKPKERVKKMGRPKLSPRQKLLTQMTKTKWAKYKRGSGKKTYVDIRAQVSRSAEYKRKAKRL